MQATLALLLLVLHSTDGAHLSHRPARVPTPALRRRAAAAPAAKLEAPPTPSLYPQWPEEAVSGRRELDVVADAFVETVTSVPLRASSEPDDAVGGWRAWSDGGFAAHKFIASKLSRKTYPLVLSLLLQLLVVSQANYPDLYAVLKFVPKKNGLNPILARLQVSIEKECATVADEEYNDCLQGGVEVVAEDSVSIEHLKPREVRRKLDDLARALEQSWLMLGCYLTLPSKPHRNDFLWSARTVAEKIKTDQRSRALEILCLGFFGRGGALYPVVGRPHEAPLKAGFETSFGIDTWHPKPTNARMIWQRSRMVYPFLEAANRAWLAKSAAAAPGDGSSDGGGSGDGSSGGGGGGGGGAARAYNVAAVGELLDRIARASPEEKVLNSLLYWPPRLIAC